MIERLYIEMKQFLQDIKENVKDLEEEKYLLKRTERLYDIIFKEIGQISDYRKKQIKEIKDIQENNKQKIEELEEQVKQIYTDIYDEEYDEFEIECPYCNRTFEANIDDKINEIICPECDNIIELDWNEDENE